MSAYFPSLKDLAGKVILEKNLPLDRLDQDCRSLLTRRFLSIGFSLTEDNFFLLIDGPFDFYQIKTLQPLEDVRHKAVEINPFDPSPLYLKITCGKEISFSYAEEVSCQDKEKGFNFFLLLSSKIDKGILYGNNLHGLLFYHTNGKLENFQPLSCKNCFIV